MGFIQSSVASSRILSLDQSLRAGVLLEIGKWHYRDQLYKRDGSACVLCWGCSRGARRRIDSIEGKPKA